jgi:hypothetical protein
LPLSIILVVLPVTGCTGGEGPTNAQYVSGLNAMCVDFRQREKAIGEPQTIADLITKGPLILDAFENAIAEKVGLLKAPDAIADRAERLVDLAEKQHDVLAALIEAARNGEVAKVQALASQNATLNEEANSIAQDLGADACASGK